MEVDESRCRVCGTELESVEEINGHPRYSDPSIVCYRGGLFTPGCKYFLTGVMHCHCNGKLNKPGGVTEREWRWVFPTLIVILFMTALVLWIVSSIR